MKPVAFRVKVRGDHAEITGVLASVRGTRYLGKTVRVKKEPGKKAEFTAAVEQALEEITA